MDKKLYEKKRTDLMALAEKLINGGKAVDAKKKIEEVKALDKRFDDEAVAQANLAALKDRTVAVDLKAESKEPRGVHEVGRVESVKPHDEAELYKVAFYKKVTGRAMNSDEQNIFSELSRPKNEFTHTTENTGILIPETVAAGIWKRAEELYPLYADAAKYAVPGKFTMKKHAGIAAGDAAWYEEPTPTADEQNNFEEFTLDGRELSKSVTVSWKMKAMAMDAFLPFLQNELGERIGVALGHAAVSGKGVMEVQAPEPQGVETVILTPSNAQLINYDDADDKLTYSKLTEAIAKIHSSYLAGAAIYANNQTIWTALANLLDGTGRPLFIPDVTSGGVGRILGLVVKADAAVPDGDILFGNANAGLVFNTNQALTMVTEDHAKARETDYVAYAITDCGVLDEKAFALLSQTVPQAG